MSELDYLRQWYEARRLGGEPHLEWSFPILLHRRTALEAESGPFERRGLDFAYEPLGSWEELVGAFALRRALRGAGIRGEWWPTASIGLEFFEAGFYAPLGRLALPGSGDPFRGRHLVAVADATDAELKVISSWSKWGEQGTGRFADMRFGFVPRDYFEAHVDAIWLSRAAWVGPSPEMDRRLRELNLIAGAPGRPNEQRFAESWTTANVRQEKGVSVGARELRLRRRLTFSLRNDAPHLDLLDLHDGVSPVARAHVLHLRDRNYSVVEELFVPPDARRQGLGRSLVEHCADLARHRDRTSLRLLLHEADDSATGRATALGFATSMGFSWVEQPRKRPNTPGYAAGDIR